MRIKYLFLFMCLISLFASADSALQPIEQTAGSRFTTSQSIIFSACYRIGMMQRSNLTHYSDILNQLKQANATATPRESRLIVQLSQTMVDGFEHQQKMNNLCTQLIQKG